jgi:hypothetical protein
VCTKENRREEVRGGKRTEKQHTRFGTFGEL